MTDDRMRVLAERLLEATKAGLVAWAPIRGAHGHEKWMGTFLITLIEPKSGYCGKLVLTHIPSNVRLTLEADEAPELFDDLLPEVRATSSKAFSQRTVGRDEVLDAAIGALS